MDDPLKEYRSKRNFSSTAEPRGRVRKSGHALRFCVQHHFSRREHFDLRLEYGGVALSWAVPKGPSSDPKEKRLAVRVEDHPVDYMTFEGTIPDGEYGAGRVELWDEGTWEPRSEVGAGLSEGSLKLTLMGTKLKGRWALVRMEGENWLLIKEKDAEAPPARAKKRGTGKRGNPFSEAEVMLARPCDELPVGTGWSFELKYDGHRTLGFVDGGGVRLVTRNGKAALYPAAAEALRILSDGRAAVVDGEMVVADENGISDFSALQSYARGGGGRGVTYVLFDLLALDGEDLRPLPLSERRRKLKAFMKGAPPVLAYSASVSKMTEENLRVLRERGVEGVVAKRTSSPYIAGKNGDWLKLKFRRSDEFVVGGYTLGEEGVKALLLGEYEGDMLAYVGRAGTGFSADERRLLARQLSAIRSGNCPFLRPPHVAGAVWVRPLLVAEVGYAERTAAGLLRQASFKRLREDKAPGETGESFFGVRITHPEKPMFRGGPTKGELAAYYAAAAPRMLPYLRGRTLSLLCRPSGAEGEAFFRRHLQEDVEGVGRRGDSFFVENERGLLSLVQNNTVEFHICGGNGKGCDTLVFDLDPDEDVPLSGVRRAAREVRELLLSLGLTSFVKTSGGKGYHIVVPLRVGVPQSRARDFSKEVVLLLERRHPERYTSSSSKRARKGKVFVDWQRNGAGATSAAPYSVRAREKATVSMPIRWEELGRVAPDGITVERAWKRLEEDPWAEYDEVKKGQALRSGEEPPDPN